MCWRRCVFRPCLVSMIVCIGWANSVQATGGSLTSIGLTGQKISGIVLLPGASPHLYACGHGVYKTPLPSLGRWERTAAPLSHCTAFASNPEKPGWIAAAEEDAIYYSESAGDEWGNIRSSTTGEKYYALVFLDGLLYAGTSNGVIYYNRESDKWYGAGPGLPAHAKVYALAANPSDAGILYAGTNFGVYKKTSSGWREFSDASIVDSEVKALGVRPDNGTVFAGMAAIGSDPLTEQNQGGVYRRESSRTRWENNSTGLGTPQTEINVTSFAFNPGAPQQMFVGLGGAKNGTFQSTDGGAHWNIMGDKYASEFYGTYSLAVDPERNKIYVGREKGVYSIDYTPVSPLYSMYPVVHSIPIFSGTPTATHGEPAADSGTGRGSRDGADTGITGPGTDSGLSTVEGATAPGGTAPVDTRSIENPVEVNNSAEAAGSAGCRLHATAGSSGLGYLGFFALALAIKAVARRRQNS